MNFVFINSGELIVAAKRSNYSQPATQSLAQYCKFVQKIQLMSDNAMGDLVQTFLLPKVRIIWLCLLSGSVVA